MIEITPAVDATFWQVLNLGSCAVGEVEWEVLDNEEVIIRSPRHVGRAVVLKPPSCRSCSSTEARCWDKWPRVFAEVQWRPKSSQERGLADAPPERSSAASLGARAACKVRISMLSVAVLPPWRAGWHDLPLVLEPER